MFFEPARQTIWFVFDNLVEVTPLVAPGIIVAGWVNASGAGDWFAWRLTGKLGFMIVAASAIGAVTPVCGAAVLPLMLGLLASGVPLAPVMAFWLSSPITDPALIAATAATLGFGFATGTTLAAFALGLVGGFGTRCIGKRNWTMDPLRKSLAGGGNGCIATGKHGKVEPRIWLSKERMSRFRGEVVGITRLILICLIPAFAAEHLLRGILDPELLGTYLGEDAHLVNSDCSVPRGSFLHRGFRRASTRAQPDGPRHVSWCSIGISGVRRSHERMGDRGDRSRAETCGPSSCMRLSQLSVRFSRAWCLNLQHETATDPMWCSGLSLQGSSGKPRTSPVPVTRPPFWCRDLP